jgi:hypothetical protein
MEGKKWECKETVHQIFINYQKDYDYGNREVMYSILTGFGGTHETRQGD